VIKSPNRESDATPAADRVLAVLDLLSGHRHPMPSMAIARGCDIPRSTVYRLLHVMRAREYVTYDRRARTWSLGPRLSQVGAASPTLAQALEILEAFDSRTPRLSVAELAARAGLDVARTSELVDPLVSEGLLSVDAAGRIGLGLRVVGLAARVEPVEHLLRVARPRLEQLRDRTGETANLVVRDGSNALYLDQVESPRALRVSGWIGRRIPLAGSASGAALTGPGVHVVADAVESGVIAVACGIDGVAGIDAAVSVTAPALRLQGSLLTNAEAEVQAAADDIARALAEGTPRTDGVSRAPTGSRPDDRVSSPARCAGRNA
jgi:DNA-binding IclR family transcriptional regulator